MLSGDRTAFCRFEEKQNFSLDIQTDRANSLVSILRKEVYLGQIFEKASGIATTNDQCFCAGIAPA